MLLDLLANVIQVSVHGVPVGLSIPLYASFEQLSMVQSRVVAHLLESQTYISNIFFRYSVKC